MKGRVKKVLKAFMLWWLNELRSMVPASLKRSLFPRAVDLCMVPEAGCLSFFLRDDNRLSRLIEIELDEGDETLARRLNQTLSDENSDSRRVTILLPDNQVLRPEIELPVDAAENLAEVLAFEMDRHTPFSAEEVFFDYRILGTDPDLKRLTVKMLVARKTDVERAVEFAKKLDLEVSRVTALNIPWDQGDFNLLTRAKTKFTPGEWRQAAAAAAVVLILAALIFLPLDRKARTVESLEAEAARLRDGASQATQLLDKAEQLRESSKFIIDAKDQRLTIMALLEDITRQIPNGSWLTNLTIRRGEVAMTGYSGDPSSILRGLENSGFLRDAKFSAPVTHDARLETDRFRLTAKVTQGADP